MFIEKKKDHYCNMTFIGKDHHIFGKNELERYMQIFENVNAPKPLLYRFNIASTNSKILIFLDLSRTSAYCDSSHRQPSLTKHPWSTPKKRLDLPILLRLHVKAKQDPNASEGML